MIKSLLRIPVCETSTARRGFHVRLDAMTRRLETIGETFLHGYHAALTGTEDIARGIDSELQGFAFEGAAMALTLMDHMLPVGGRRLQRFMRGAGEPHLYMLHVGAGWALGRIPWLRWRLDAFLNTLDPLLRWLALDGYGFHQGYFHWPEFIRAQRVPRVLQGYARRGFDQGLGRSLWFVEGGDIARIAATIGAFPAARRADLWSGTGLASAYAGGAAESDLEMLREAGGKYLPQAAQGAAFAAQARERAGNPAHHTDTACRILCGTSARDAAAVTEAALADLPGDGVAPAYEIWRCRIQEQFTLSHQFSGGVLL